VLVTVSPLAAGVWGSPVSADSLAQLGQLTADSATLLDETMSRTVYDTLGKAILPRSSMKPRKAGALQCSAEPRYSVHIYAPQPDPDHHKHLNDSDDVLDTVLARSVVKPLPEPPTQIS
jgi:hypothetical protein